jgi:quercetin dioxygenase-like cupin family protein
MSVVPAAAQPYVMSLDEDAAKYFLGVRSWLRAGAAETGGSMGIVEQAIPSGFASPYHVHHAEDELWYVLEGSVRFVSGSTSIVAPKGGVAFLPRDVPHGFEVVGSTEARMLAITTPSGFEAFVEELSDPVPPSAPSDMATLIQVAQRYGLEILGPLPELA